MKLELNLWFNKNQSINGRLNINAGESIHKFSNLDDIDKFIARGVFNGVATEQEFVEIAQSLNLDPDARYAWLDDNFVYWNSLKKVAYVFYTSKIYKLPLNTRYSKKYSTQPDICFETIV